MDELFILVLVSITLLFIIISEYSLNIKKVYPMWVMSLFSEPLTRFLLYTLIYVSACFDMYVSILLTFFVVLLHIDYINLTQ